MNAADLLKGVNVQAKVLNQLLDRLIPSDDSHTVITEGHAYSIEVIPQNLMTYRIPAKGCNSPAKFNITFNDSHGQQVGAIDDLHAAAQKKTTVVSKDLRIYVSLDEKEPKEGNCDQSFFSENSFFVHAKNKQTKIFETNNIYISFLSVKGCSINVKVRFVDPRGHRRVAKEKIILQDDLEMEENLSSDPFRKLRAKMRDE